MTTIAEVFVPSEGSLVEFWPTGMSGKTGIEGWFRDNRFWSLDGADHWSRGEVVRYEVRRNALQCAARGCDGCLVCKPFAIK